MRLQQPQLPLKRGLESIQVAELMSETALERIFLEGADVVNLDAKSLSLEGSLLEKVIAREAKLEKFGLSDAGLRACDLSAAQCLDASFIRVRIVGCRMAGIDLSRSTLKDVVFESCKLDMANFRFTKLTRVQFIDCTLVETDFQAAELNQVSFQSSHLERVEFSHGKLKNVDARSSQLLDIRGWQSLRGLTIDSTQLVTIAPQLALDLGLVIAD